MRPVVVSTAIEDAPVYTREVAAPPAPEPEPEPEYNYRTATGFAAALAVAAAAEERQIAEGTLSADTPVAPELNDLGATATITPIDKEDLQQRAPLADAQTSGQLAAKSLLTMLPNISLDAPEDSSALPVTSAPVGVQSASTTSSFAPVSAAGMTTTFAPVSDDFYQNVDADSFVDDADDSAYMEHYTQTGAFAGPGYVDMPSHRCPKFLGKVFGGKKKEEEVSTQEWLGVDDDFDARSVGAARGGWESFRQGFAEEDGQDYSQGYGEGYGEDYGQDYGEDDGSRNWNGGGFSIKGLAKGLTRGRGDAQEQPAEDGAYENPAGFDEFAEGDYANYSRYDNYGDNAGYDNYGNYGGYAEQGNYAEGGYGSYDNYDNYGNYNDNAGYGNYNNYGGYADQGNYDFGGSANEGYDAFDASAYAPEAAPAAPYAPGAFDDETAAYGAYRRPLGTDEDIEEPSADAFAAYAPDEADEPAPDAFAEDEQAAFRPGASRGSTIDDFAQSAYSAEESKNLQEIFDFRDANINAEVWFVALGSEHPTNSGMRAFLDAHGNELKNAIFIEIEGMGAGTLSLTTTEGKFRRFTVPTRMRRYVQKAQEALHVQVSSAPYTIDNSATYQAMARGMQAMHLVGMDGAKPALQHQANDVAENVDEEKLHRNAEYVMELVRSI